MNLGIDTLRTRDYTTLLNMVRNFRVILYMPLLLPTPFIVLLPHWDKIWQEFIHICWVINISLIYQICYFLSFYFADQLTTNSQQAINQPRKSSSQAKKPTKPPKAPQKRREKAKRVFFFGYNTHINFPEALKLIKRNVKLVVVA